ncbi:MAG: MBL fold metallo-hydrolase [Candidatus Hodarchaeota archaeon]
MLEKNLNTPMGNHQMLEQFAENLFLVYGKNQGKFPNSHSILIQTSNSEAILIDTGCGIDILKNLRQEFDIVSVINSHTHPDHYAGNWLFQDDNCSIYTPKEGFKTAGDIVALSERFAEPGRLAESWQYFASSMLEFKGSRPTHSYTSKSQFDFGEVKLLPIHTPGHTIDHYCFYEPDEKILFAFDYDLTSFGPWYGHRESNISEFKRSGKQLIELNPKMLISSHKGIVRDNIANKLEVFCRKINERDDRILALLKEGSRTVGQLVNNAPIYRAFPYAEPLLKYWEGQMIKKHLEDLEEQEQVFQSGTEWILQT